MPTSFRSAASVTGHCQSFFPRRCLRRVARIKTDENYLIILPRVERNRFQRADNPFFDLVAEHWAVIVDKRKKHGFPSKVLTELDNAAGFIPKSQVECHLGVQWRVKAHVKQVRW